MHIVVHVVTVDYGVFTKVKCVASVIKERCSVTGTLVKGIFAVEVVGVVFGLNYRVVDSRAGYGEPAGKVVVSRIHGLEVA